MSPSILFRWVALAVFVIAIPFQSADAQQTKPSVKLSKAATVVAEIDTHHLTRFDSRFPFKPNNGLKAEFKPHEGFYFRVAKPQFNKTKAATITVNFQGDWASGDGPAAQAAVNRAVATWEATLDTPVEIRIDANFAELGENVLGSAGPCVMYVLSGFGPSTPVNSNGSLVVGAALADKLNGADINPAGCDISMSFSSEFANWNFSTDPPTGSEWDFESVVLHEIGHGLDFLGLMSHGLADCGAADAACQKVPFGAGYETIEIWNWFVEDGAGTEIWDYVAFPDSSSDLGDAVLGHSPTPNAGLFWMGASAVAENGGPARLYTPDPFESGSSFSHLDEATFNGTIDNLMTPSIFNGEVARTPGVVTCGMMEDQGWGLNGVAGDCPFAALPVEMTDFLATVDGYDVFVGWKTVTESNNSGFELQHKVGDANFETVAFIPGAGTSTTEVDYSYRVADVVPGRHAFRLNQIDVDGTSVTGPEIEAFVGVPNDFYLRPAFPNPFTESATVQFAVGTSQPLRVELYDGQGRMVRVLFDSVVNANEQYEAVIDAAGLASGVYAVRLAGERTVGTQRVVLMK